MDLVILLFSSGRDILFLVTGLDGPTVIPCVGAFLFLVGLLTLHDDICLAATSKIGSFKTLINNCQIELMKYS